MRLVIGRLNISAKFLEPKVEIFTQLEEGSTSPPLMGEI